MAKGQQKPARDKKKPKQDKSASPKPQSAYQQSMAGNAAAQPFAKKK